MRHFRYITERKEQRGTQYSGHACAFPVHKINQMQIYITLFAVLVISRFKDITEGSYISSNLRQYLSAMPNHNFSSCKSICAHINNKLKKTEENINHYF